ncbi:hypothetical protein [Paraburkholderia youngii]|uniref:hypothetical protein n=1 Tax=Paraburkholderia youngii TaxID=2782701 RepID=UPI003D1AF0C7
MGNRKRTGNDSRLLFHIKFFELRTIFQDPSSGAEFLKSKHDSLLLNSAAGRLLKMIADEARENRANSQGIGRIEILCRTTTDGTYNANTDCRECNSLGAKSAGQCALGVELVR